MALHVIFDIRFTYYFPQYEPVLKALLLEGARCDILVHPAVHPALEQQIQSRYGIECIAIDDETQAIDRVNQKRPHWFVLGHGIANMERIHPPTQTALIFHGLDSSFKAATLAPGLNAFDVRFLSGRGRSQFLKQALPDVTYVESGFAKLDPLMPPDKRHKEPQFLTRRGLDPKKKTLLYAPTFYPSSLENFPRRFPKDFRHYNILIKAHDFTLNKKKYRHQLKKLTHWASFDNVYLASDEEFSLLPFMSAADLMISDTSSAVYEFAALNKPVIICGFIYLRWSYRGPFRAKAKKRLDASTEAFQKLAEKVPKYSALKAAVERDIQHPKRLEKERLEISDQVVGPRDGLCSQRIVDYLKRHAAD
ncbi:CDP-glycerol:poly(glycerophosphate) glycerophosphotransferase [gamma proteobacterium HTCC5015]|nr:CDP-glycerol:poly(glycerophosphate) glycerophosphotransferase [gamma proteobacterium HTCC5015]